MKNPFTDSAKDASEKTTQHFKDKISKLTAQQLNNILDKLQKTSVNKDVVDSLTKTIHSATDKNKKLQEIVDKGDAIAQVIMNIIKQI